MVRAAVARIARLAILAVVCLAVGPSSLALAQPSRHDRRPVPSVKAQIVGLVDKGSEAPYHLGMPFATADPDEIAPDAKAFAAIVVNESWAQLEPSQGRFTFGPLEASLNAVTAYNRAHRHHQLTVKLRFWGGFAAPEWAKTIAGSPVSFNTPSAHGTTGRWWTDAYENAWSAFQHALAERYDRDSLIGSVAVSSCATLTAEPFTMSPSQALLSELLSDGWSSAAQHHCLDGAFSDYSGWKRTPIDYAFNTFPAVTPGEHVYHPDPAVTDEVMTRCADLLTGSGRSCILSNHALDASSATTSRQAPVYAEIDTLYNYLHGKAPVDFQTNSPNTFGGCQTIDIAIAHHAQSLELWPPTAHIKGFTAYTESSLYGWARALRERRRIAC
jgi:hypothetical protein